MNKTRGRPRMPLDEVARQWDGPRSAHAERHAARSLGTFYRHLFNLWPQPLRTHAENYGLAIMVRKELPCLCLSPFADPSTTPLPPGLPTRDTAGPPPNMGMPHEPGQAPTDPYEGGGGPLWRRSLLEGGHTVAVEHGGAMLHFGEHIHYMMALAFTSHLYGWEDYWERRGAAARPEYATDIRPGVPPDAPTRRLHADLARLAKAQAAS